MISKKPQKVQKCTEKKGVTGSANCGEQRWYCRDCALMLTSKLQAQEHFFGKRHQSVIKSKDPCHWHIQSSLRGTQQLMPAKKNIVSYEKLQNLDKSSLSNYWKPKLCNSSSDIIPPPAGKDNILQTVIKSEKKTFYFSDLSIYRTPSGKYYCQPCNITVNSQTQFLQHSESRKHKHKASRASFKVK